MRERAQIQLVKSYHQSELSRLALSVLRGTLQSFVPAPPQRHRGPFHEKPVHIIYLVIEKPNSFSIFYSSVIALSPLGHLDLEWWDKVLTRGFEEQCQTPNFSMLAVAWGGVAATAAEAALFSL
jgi:hypothetical protein